MTKLRRVLVWAFIDLVVLVAIAITLTIGWRPFIGPRARALKGQPLPGLDFAGGFVLDGPWGRVASANITPDASGIPYYDEALFAEVMRTGYVKARKLNQIMPWHSYRAMTDEDLAAMFAYVKTFKPVQHHVDNSQPAAYCKVCRQTHGSAN
jgi:hypothetical protein